MRINTPILPSVEGFVDWFKGLFNKSQDKNQSSSGAGPGGPPGMQGSGGTMVPGQSPSETPSEDVINPDNSVQDNSSLDNSSSSTDPYVEEEWNFSDYLEGLFASQGHENDINRQYNSAQAAANRQFQSDEAQIQRDWYESMSNSAYQRAVADMKAAGINPILAYQNGGAASSGTGIAAGSAASYNSGGGDSLSSVLSSVADVMNSFTGSSARKVFYFSKILKILS